MLQKLRAKPTHIKKSIALVVTIIIFSGIVFVWLSSWDMRLGGSGGKGSALSPIEGFKELFREAMTEAQSSATDLPAYKEAFHQATRIIASSSEPFDVSGVVVIDPFAESGSAATSTEKQALTGNGDMIQ